MFTIEFYLIKLIENISKMLYQTRHYHLNHYNPLHLALNSLQYHLAFLWELSVNNYLRKHCCHQLSDQHLVLGCGIQVGVLLRLVIHHWDQVEAINDVLAHLLCLEHVVLHGLAMNLSSSSYRMTVAVVSWCRIVLLAGHHVLTIVWGELMLIYRSLTRSKSTCWIKVIPDSHYRGRLHILAIAAISFLANAVWVDGYIIMAILMFFIK